MWVGIFVCWLYVSWSGLGQFVAPTTTQAYHCYKMASRCFTGNIPVMTAFDQPVGSGTGFEKVARPRRHSCASHVRPTRNARTQRHTCACGRTWGHMWAHMGAHVNAHGGTCARNARVMPTRPNMMNMCPQAPTCPHAPTCPRAHMRSCLVHMGAMSTLGCKNALGYHPSYLALPLCPSPPFSLYLPLSLYPPPTTTNPPTHRPTMPTVPTAAAATVASAPSADSERMLSTLPSRHPRKRCAHYLTKPSHMAR